MQVTYVGLALLMGGGGPGLEFADPLRVPLRCRLGGGPEDAGEEQGRQEVSKGRAQSGRNLWADKVACPDHHAGTALVARHLIGKR